MGADLSFQLPIETLDEDDSQRIFRDEFGATTRVFKGRESVPEPLAWTITDRKAWEAHKPLLAWNDARVNWEGALEYNRALREQGFFVTLHAGFGYDRVMRFAGAVRVLEAMHDDPAWIRDMLDTIAETVIVSCEELLARGIRLDAAFVWNDMAYRNGPFFSPAMYREFELPGQKRMCDFFHARELPVILHTDGDVRPILPDLLEAGFDCLQPVESKAGMDLVELKRDYGDRLAFMGGIDVRAMAHPDPSVIEQEVARKVPVAKQNGGYIYHSDHSVPDNVSFAQYCRTIELVNHYGAYGS
jgi:uroporphyrinogen decarboxylase